MIAYINPITIFFFHHAFSFSKKFWVYYLGAILFAAVGYFISQWKSLIRISQAYPLIFIYLLLISCIVIVSYRIISLGVGIIEGIILIVLFSLWCFSLIKWKYLTSIRKVYLITFIYCMMTNYILLFAYHLIVIGIISSIRLGLSSVPDFIFTLVIAFIFYPSGWLSCLLLCLLHWRFSPKVQEES